jgi:hypothetical protein
MDGTIVVGKEFGVRWRTRARRSPGWSRLRQLSGRAAPGWLECVVPRVVPCSIKASPATPGLGFVSRRPAGSALRRAVGRTRRPAMAGADSILGSWDSARREARGSGSAEPDGGIPS